MRRRESEAVAVFARAHLLGTIGRVVILVALVVWEAVGLMVGRGWPTLSHITREVTRSPVGRWHWPAATTGSQASRSGRSATTRDQDPDDEPTGPAPLVAVRVRATIGRPGASAQAAYRRRRAAKWAAWTRTLPLRMVLALAAGAGVGLLAAAGLAWVLRFRSRRTPAPGRGAAGERRTARLLRRLEDRGWVVLRDLAIPGSPANIDHLLIGPGGVVVIDSKQYRGRLQLSPEGCCGMAATRFP